MSEYTVERVRPHLERAVFFFGIINPLTALPQLYQIWALHAVAGLSPLTVSAALFMSVLWTTYGLFGRHTVLWVTSAAWVVMNLAILVGVFVHG